MQEIYKEFMWEKSMRSKQSLNTVTLALAGSLLNPWRIKLKELVLLSNEIYKYKAMRWVLSAVNNEYWFWIPLHNGLGTQAISTQCYYKSQL
jgi:hypothetical protein